MPKPNTTDFKMPLAVVTEHLSDEPTQWLAERCEFRPMVGTSSTVLYESWKRWCEQNGITPKSMKRLSPELERRGLTKVRTNKERGFRGIVVTHV